jgi:hypothetical protein
VLTTKRFSLPMMNAGPLSSGFFAVILALGLQYYGPTRTGVPLFFHSSTSFYVLSRRSHEEAEGFLSYRIADRRGDHFDHRGHRNPEPHSFQNGSERVFGSGLSPYD